MGIGARTEEQWVHLLAWLEEEGLIEDLGEYLNRPTREAMRRGDAEAREHQRKVASVMRELAAKMDADELFKRAQSLGFQWGIINAPEDVLEDPHFQARGFPRRGGASRSGEELHLRGRALRPAEGALGYPSPRPRCSVNTTRRCTRANWA